MPPIDDDILKFPIITLDISDVPKLEGGKMGQEGTGRFNFRLVHDEMSGTVQLELHQLEIETKNSADAALEDLQGQGRPAEGSSSDADEEEENDDI